MRASAAALVLGLTLASTRAHAQDPDPWFGADKGLHFAATSALALAGYGAVSLLDSPRPTRLVAGAALALGAGVAKELWDLSGHGSASWRDLTWDAIGCAVGLAVAWVLDAVVFGSAATTAPREGPAPGLAGTAVRFGGAAPAAGSCCAAARR